MYYPVEDGPRDFMPVYIDWIKLLNQKYLLKMKL